MSAEVWTARDAAAFLRVGVKTIYAICKAKQLRHVVVNDRGDIRTSRAWCEAYLERFSTGGAA